MFREELKVVTTPWFLLALLILLLNDFVFKDYYGNGVTGKLSDFSGLFVFPLFWIALFPRYRLSICGLTAIAFVFWKSSYSQPVIEGWNSLGWFAIGRVVDYTDLWALSVLPIVYFLADMRVEHNPMRISPSIPLAVSVFAFAATSKMPSRCYTGAIADYRVSQFSRDSLIQRLREHTLQVSFDHNFEGGPTNDRVIIHDLNDTIETLDFSIGYPEGGDAVLTLSVVSWEFSPRSPLAVADSDTCRAYEAYVRRVFEDKVLSKLVLADTLRREYRPVD